MIDAEYDKATALKDAKRLYGENAIVWEDGDLKCVGAHSGIYPQKRLNTTSWKNFTFGDKVRWGSALTWKDAVKSANRTSALKAHDNAVKLKAHDDAVKRVKN